MREGEGERAREREEESERVRGRARERGSERDTRKRGGGRERERRRLAVMRPPTAARRSAPTCTQTPCPPSALGLSPKKTLATLTGSATALTASPWSQFSFCAWQGLSHAPVHGHRRPSQCLSSTVRRPVLVITHRSLSSLTPSLNVMAEIVSFASANFLCRVSTVRALSHSHATHTSIT